jgi:hypothetical protein
VSLITAGRSQRFPGQNRLSCLEKPTVFGGFRLGYVTTENYKRFYVQMVENIRAWLDGKPVRVIPPK